MPAAVIYLLPDNSFSEIKVTISTKIEDDGQSSENSKFFRIAT